jgi:hypothetical protein
MRSFRPSLRDLIRFAAFSLRFDPGWEFIRLSTPARPAAF